MSQWVVVLNETRGLYAFGPLGDREEAKAFAQFLSAEVDPACAVRLTSPVAELLGWWRQRRDGETQPSVEEGMWPPKLGDTWQDKRGDRWLAVPGAQLLHLAGVDGAAPYDEIWRLFGPLALVNRSDVKEPEVPF